MKSISKSVFDFLEPRQYTKEHGIKKLNMELYTLYRKLLPTDEEIAMRRMYLRQMQLEVFRLLNTGDTKGMYVVCAFGSTDTGLYLPTGDVDLVILPRSEEILELVSDGQRKFLKQYMYASESDEKLCDEKLCDEKLCDEKLCDEKMCDEKLSDVNLSISERQAATKDTPFQTKSSTNPENHSISNNGKCKLPKSEENVNRINAVLLPQNKETFSQKDNRCGINDKPPSNDLPSDSEPLCDNEQRSYSHFRIREIDRTSERDVRLQSTDSTNSSSNHPTDPPFPFPDPSSNHPTDPPFPFPDPSSNHPTDPPFPFPDPSSNHPTDPPFPDPSSNHPTDPPNHPTHSEPLSKRKIDENGFSFSKRSKQYESMSVISSYYNVFSKHENFSNDVPSKSKAPTRKQMQNNVLTKLQDLLSKSDIINKNTIFHIQKARIPIIKCRNVHNLIEFDISFNDLSVLKHNVFIRDELIKRPFLKPLVLLFKLFLKMRSLCESFFGGMCSYAQLLFILHFIKMHPVLQVSDVSVVYNLGVIFMDFFQYYGTIFPYTNVTLDNLSVLYKMQSSGCAIVSLEDPMYPLNDVGDNCSQMYSIVEAMQHAYRVMREALKSYSSSRFALVQLWMPDMKSVDIQRAKVLSQYRESLGTRK